MTDGNLRDLERAWKTSGVPSDEEAYLREIDRTESHSALPDFYATIHKSDPVRAGKLIRERGDWQPDMVQQALFYTLMRPKNRLLRLSLHALRALPRLRELYELGSRSSWGSIGWHREGDESVQAREDLINHPTVQKRLQHEHVFPLCYLSDLVQKNEARLLLFPYFRPHVTELPMDEVKAAQFCIAYEGGDAEGIEARLMENDVGMLVEEIECGMSNPLYRIKSGKTTMIVRGRPRNIYTHDYNEDGSPIVKPARPPRDD